MTRPAPTQGSPTTASASISTSMVEVSRLIDPAMLVEIEAEAIVGEP